MIIIGLCYLDTVMISASCDIQVKKDCCSFFFPKRTRARIRQWQKEGVVYLQNSQKWQKLLECPWYNIFRNLSRTFPFKRDKKNVISFILSAFESALKKNTFLQEKKQK